MKQSSATDYIISKVTRQKNSQRLSIFVNDKFLVGLSVMAWSKLGWCQGDKLTSSEIDQLMHTAWFDKFYQKSLVLLNLRPRSTAELERRLSLYGKKLEIEAKQMPSLIDQILSRLKAQKLLDDTLFVNWWITQRQLLKPTGKIKLTQELTQKGIDRKLIDNYFRSNLHWLEQEKKMAQALLAKKIKTVKAKDYWHKRKKCLDFLLRRGFNYGLTKALVDQLLQKR